MSLVGSLEDLSLGDILQIISLSQKSGVLALQTTGCDGRIVFVNGLVCGAAIKGGPQDLRSVLVGGGFLSDADYDAAAGDARVQGSAVREVLACTSALSSEKIDSLCREAIEAAVVTMFGWMVGDFSFDVRTESEPGDPEHLLQTGINAQYLAMEGARQSDETDKDPEGDPDGMRVDSAHDEDSTVAADSRGFDEMSAHELFGVSPDNDGGAGASSGEEDDAVQVLARSTLHRVGRAAPGAGESRIEEALRELEQLDAFADLGGSGARNHPEDEGDELSADDIQSPPFVLPRAEALDVSDEIEPILEVEPIDGEDLHDGVATTEVPVARDEVEVERATRIAAPGSSAVAAAPVSRDKRALVVVDEDLAVLEWVKRAVKADYAPIHIFQNADLALTRIRQYLVRSQAPIVLMAQGVAVDEMAGIRGTNDFVSRLKGQSPRLTVLWLREDGSDPNLRMGAADGAIVRPERKRLRPGAAADQLAADFGVRLRGEIARASTKQSGEAASNATSISPDTIRRLRDATRALTEASSRGEVLPLVIRFAAETFSRVAMFMVRDDVAIGMAQHGLDRCGGPGDEVMREIRVKVASSNWLSSVLEHGKPVIEAPSNPGDQSLAAALGDRTPGRAYLAPIASTGQVIAVLYGDNLPGEAAIGDTGALEVVLHHAGLALDRAALERALHEHGLEDAAD